MHVDIWGHMKFSFIQGISITEAAPRIRVCNPSQQEMKDSHQLQTVMDAVLHPLNCPLLNPWPVCLCTAGPGERHSRSVMDVTCGLLIKALQANTYLHKTY